MKERVGDEKLIIIISVTVRGINDHNMVAALSLYYKILQLNAGDSL